MKNLLDRSFWKFLSGFLLILAVCILLLVITDTFEKAKEQVATLLEAL